MDKEKIEKLLKGFFSWYEDNFHSTRVNFEDWKKPMEELFFSIFIINQKVLLTRKIFNKNELLKPKDVCSLEFKILKTYPPVRLARNVGEYSYSNSELGIIRFKILVKR